MHSRSLFGIGDRRDGAEFAPRAPLPGALHFLGSDSGELGGAFRRMEADPVTLADALVDYLDARGLQTLIQALTERH